jgi:hypothetical protein
MGRKLLYIRTFRPINLDLLEKWDEGVEFRAEA